MIGINKVYQVAIADDSPDLTPKNVEVGMYKISLIYNPDEQQVLEHHKELLKKAEQVQLEHPVTETPKHSTISLGERIKHWFSSHRPINMVHVHSHSHSRSSSRH